MKKRFIISSLPLSILKTNTLKSDELDQVSNINIIIDTQRNLEYHPEWGDIDNPCSWRKVSVNNK